MGWAQTTVGYYRPRLVYPKDIPGDLRSAPTPAVLYHFTNFAAFLSIIATRSLRMMEAQSLNDVNEGWWMLRCIDHWLTSVPLEGDVRRRIEEFRVSSLPASPEATFLTSFSPEPNREWQWEQYADRGQGVAIGFDPQQLGVSFQRPDLRLFSPSAPFDLSPVVYSDILGFGIDRRPTFLHDDLRTLAATATEKTIDIACRWQEQLPLLKHDTWADEREWRIVYRPYDVIDPEVPPDTIIDDTDNYLHHYSVLNKEKFRVVAEQVACAKTGSAGYRGRGQWYGYIGSARYLPPGNPEADWHPRRYFRFRFLPRAVSTILLGPTCPASVEDTQEICNRAAMTEVTIDRFKSSLRR